MILFEFQDALEALFLRAIQIFKKAPMPPEPPKQPVAPQPAPTPSPAPTTPTAPNSASQTPSEVDILHSDIIFPNWSTPEHARHNVRVICDQEGLTLDQKKSLCATVECESQFNLNAIHVNYVWVNGVRHIASTDHGICQWNDYYHGKEITPAEAVNDPEKAVRLMCKYWKQGLMRQWVCYSQGMYRQYL